MNNSNQREVNKCVSKIDKLVIKYVNKQIDEQTNCAYTLYNNIVIKINNW
jgi:hypothetical protein